MMKLVIAIMAACCLALLTLSTAWAKEPSLDELNRESQNPVADLISLPFQNNTNFNMGPHNRTQNLLNIQPVIPFHLSTNWNLITRTIMPVVYQPDLAESSGGTWAWATSTPRCFFLQPSRVKSCGAWDRCFCCPPPRMRCWDWKNGARGYRAW